MQTEYARQQQLISVGMLALLLGPLTLVVAGVIAGLVGRSPYGGPNVKHNHKGTFSVGAPPVAPSKRLTLW
jgi:hypothetical protein